LAALCAEPARAFCGFYVAKADTTIFNNASQVAIARDGDRTTMTMANDFRGDLKEFAVVIPVPTVVKREEIAVSDKALLDHLDAYSAPRLVEYFDPDPCAERDDSLYDRLKSMAVPAPMASMGYARRRAGRHDRGAVHGGRVRHPHPVREGERRARAVAARERLPHPARRVAGARQLHPPEHALLRRAREPEEQAKTGYTFLRPLQVSYTSPKFMLPIRLGTVNATGPQELFVYASRRRAASRHQLPHRPARLGPGDPALREGRVRAVLQGRVRRAGAPREHERRLPRVRVGHGLVRSLLGGSAVAGGAAQARRDVGERRLPHAAARPLRPRHFPEDLVFQETGDRESFQGRYVLRQPFTGNATCSAADAYQRRCARARSARRRRSRR
jgi:hypothetical protein